MFSVSLRTLLSVSEEKLQTKTAGVIRNSRFQSLLGLLAKSSVEIHGSKYQLPEFNTFWQFYYSSLNSTFIISFDGY